MTLIEVRNGSGQITGRCDARCYDAHEPECDCICGGKNHGAGLRNAVSNTEEMAPELLQKDGVQIHTPHLDLIGDEKQAGKITGHFASRKVFINGCLLSPAQSQKIRNHSPDGFMWGYGGSAPAQLSLAILLKLTNKETAASHYQQFKWDVISGLPQDDFEIPIETVHGWLKERGVAA